ncbi:MAG: S1C family serine protease [Alphaproteobacteria bacterium]
MQGIDRANGQRPSGLLHLLHPALKSAPKPKPEELPFDLESALAAILPLHTEIPSDAFTASILGTEREGNGVLIDDDGLLLTIGYLIVESTVVNVVSGAGKTVPCAAIAYDYDTGFGLVRATAPLGVKPMELGSSAELEERDQVIISAHGGLAQTISGYVVSKREFAGYWEYLLDEAIFTSPLHPNWGGAALIGADGKLVGIGSLFVEDALPAEDPIPGNMFVPIDLLKPIFSDLLTKGRASGASRPWLGIFTTEAFGQLVVAGVAPDGPADRAGIWPGDVVVSAGGHHVARLADFFRKVWGLGRAGVAVPLTILRDGDPLEIVIASGDRYEYLKLPHRQ